MVIWVRLSYFWLLFLRLRLSFIELFLVICLACFGVLSLVGLVCCLSFFSGFLCHVPL